MKIKSFALVVLAIVIAFSAIGLTHQDVSAQSHDGTSISSVSATCGTGYVKNSAGKCVDITKQRAIVAKSSAKASAIFICLGKVDKNGNATPATYKACMKSKGYK